MSRPEESYGSNTPKVPGKDAERRSPLDINQGERPSQRPGPFSNSDRRSPLTDLPRRQSADTILSSLIAGQAQQGDAGDVTSAPQRETLGDTSVPLLDDRPNDEGDLMSFSPVRQILHLVGEEKRAVVAEAAKYISRVVEYAHGNPETRGARPEAPEAIDDEDLGRHYPEALGTETPLARLRRGYEDLWRETGSTVYVAPTVEQNGDDAAQLTRERQGTESSNSGADSLATDDSNGDANSRDGQKEGDPTQAENPRSEPLSPESNVSDTLSPADENPADADSREDKNGVDLTQQENQETEPFPSEDDVDHEAQADIALIGKEGTPASLLVVDEGPADAEPTEDRSAAGEAAAQKEKPEEFSSQGTDEEGGSGNPPRILLASPGEVPDPPFKEIPAPIGLADPTIPVTTEIQAQDGREVIVVNVDDLQQEEPRRQIRRKSRRKRRREPYQPKKAARDALLERYDLILKARERGDAGVIQPLSDIARNLRIPTHRLRGVELRMAERGIIEIPEKGLVRKTTVAATNSNENVIVIRVTDRQTKKTREQRRIKEALLDRYDLILAARALGRNGVIPPLVEVARRLGVNNQRVSEMENQMAQRGIIEIPTKDLLIPPSADQINAYLDHLLAGQKPGDPPLVIDVPATAKELGVSPISFSILMEGRNVVRKEGDKRALTEAALRARDEQVRKTRVEGLTEPIETMSALAERIGVSVAYVSKINKEMKEAKKVRPVEASDIRIPPLSHPKVGLIRGRLMPIRDALRRGEPDTFESATAIAGDLDVPPQVVWAVAQDMGIGNRNPAHPESPQKTQVKNRASEVLAEQDTSRPVRISAREIARELGVSVKVANDGVNEVLAARGLTRDDTVEEHPARQAVLAELALRRAVKESGGIDPNLSLGKIAGRHGVSKAYVKKLEDIE